MTLDEARRGVGRDVVYRQPGSAPEYGRITSTNQRVVFVRYENSVGARATRAEDIEFR